MRPKLVVVTLLSGVLGLILIGMLKGMVGNGQSAALFHGLPLGTAHFLPRRGLAQPLEMEGVSRAFAVAPDPA